MADGAVTIQFIKHANAGDFLAATQAALEKNEAANNLMLGLALRMVKYPERIRTQPYLATVQAGKQVVAAALMTPPFGVNIFAQAATPQTALKPIVQDLHTGEWCIPFVNGMSHASDAFAEMWQSVAGVNLKNTIHERIYQLDRVIAPRWPAGQFRMARAGDVDAVSAWIGAFHDEALPHDPQINTRDWALTAIADGDAYVWEVNGKPASLARKSRATAHGQCIGPVYTPPEFRGRGYASAVTARLSQLILSSGKRFVMLFTDLSNPTSNSIYQQIGYRPVCDFNQHFFS